MQVLDIGSKILKVVHKSINLDGLLLRLLLLFRFQNWHCMLRTDLFFNLLLCLLHCLLLSYFLLLGG